ncbi:hypothetical protein Dimus_008296 [Dionaea muscipula]
MTAKSNSSKAKSNLSKAKSKQNSSSSSFKERKKSTNSEHKSKIRAQNCSSLEFQHCNQTHRPLAESQICRRRPPTGATADLPRSASPSSPPPEGLTTSSRATPDPHLGLPPSIRAARSSHKEEEVCDNLLPSSCAPTRRPAPSRCRTPPLLGN